MSSITSAFGVASTPVPSVRITSPPSWFFKFPPSPIPFVLPPPPSHPSIEHPFAIPTDIYNAALSPNVPITIALVYATVVSYLNTVNAKRKFRPWTFSKTPLFKLFAILHNLFLAVFSAWIFVGMVTTLKNSLEPWTGPYGLAGTVDSLCKLHGPRGLGSAATYNGTTSAWGFTDRRFRLSNDGLLPDNTDVGRIWNEGLAFYGWIFYLSKFYEVVDTFIILAKGKKSSLLQTYHHTGAMLSMWAGIRYMSPPIWMFCLVNAFIHTIMYTFYLSSVLGIRVPRWFKQTLTTMQIIQIVGGVMYAFPHLFVSYQIPISVPYVHHLRSAISKMISEAPSDASTISSAALTTATANLGSWLKKAALRAAGHEGLAQNVLNEKGETFGVDAVHAFQEYVSKEETRYRDEVGWVHCLDTNGQVFAILLNCLYFLPLTVLFVQFFIKAYLERSEKRRRSSTGGHTSTIAGKSGKDAVKGVARRMSEAMEELHNVSEQIGDEGVVVDGDAVRKELRQVADGFKKMGTQVTNKAKKQASKVDTKAVKQEVQRDVEKVKQSLKDAADKSKDKISQFDSESAIDSTKNAAKDASDYVSEKAGEAADKVKQTYADMANKVSDETSSSSTNTPKPEANSEGGHDSTSQPQSPNDNGTGDAEVKEHQSKAASGGTTTDDTKQVEQQKREEDKIIDESQLVRDEDVDKTSGPKLEKTNSGSSPNTPSKGKKRRG